MPENEKKQQSLVQLRTDLARLNGYLKQIGVMESDQCICAQARETVEHFLFNCSAHYIGHTETAY
jgi:hypothetical protein